jgi:hypothetical protein
VQGDGVADDGSSTSTTEATAAHAAAGAEVPPGAAGGATPAPGGEGTRFLIGEDMRRIPVQPYERQRDDPLYRPLRIYAIRPCPGSKGR